MNETPRPIEDQGPLDDFMNRLRQEGHTPYLIPGGASEHPLGCMGYLNCALELAVQARTAGITLDYLVHCTGSSSTQAGLVAGFAALGMDTRVIGISDDDEIEIKKARIRELANESLRVLGLTVRVADRDVEVHAAIESPYGRPNEEIIRAIELLARTEGLIADPVYEGRALQGLKSLVAAGRFEADASVVLMHLGGSPAVHAYAEHFGPVRLRPFDG